MRAARLIGEFPWIALDRLERRTEASLRLARRHLELGVRPELYAAGLASLMESDIEAVVLGVDSRDPAEVSVRLGFAVAGGAGRCIVGCEPALATTLLSRLLRRPAPQVDARTPLEPALLGALSALLVEAARATAPERAMVPCEVAATHRGPVVHLTVIVAGKPYAAAVWMASELAAAPRARPGALLSRLGTTPIGLPLVVAASLATPSTLQGLAVGDAWCPGAGWWVDATLTGRGVLVAPTTELGIAVELGPDGRIVLGEPATVLLSAEPMQMDDKNSGEPETLAEAVLEAPLVVRVELGQVSMTAREWAALRTGDVVETGQRIAEPVVLRGGGRELARGELVNIEGALGVRITQIIGSESA